MATQEEGERMSDAADIITGNHSENAYTMILGAIGALHDSRAGTGILAYERWITALECLGNVCFAIVKMERSNRRK